MYDLYLVLCCTFRHLHEWIGIYVHGEVNQVNPTYYDPGFGSIPWTFNPL